MPGKRRLGRDPIHFQAHLLEFSIECGAVIRRIDATARLQSKRPHTLHEIHRFIHRPIGHIDDGDGIVDIANSPIGTIDFAGQTITDLKSCRIIRCTVDTQTRG
ncbi:hypothetical protein D3C75_639640 [compost metagenome]